MTARDLSCLDWEDKLRAGKPPIREGLPIDFAAGDRAVRAFNMLRLADVPGAPRMGEAGGEWFRIIMRAMFGAIDPVTRERWLRELFLLVPKKNSKTTNGALMMLTALLLNARPAAKFVMTAPVQDVAEIAFEAARGAIELDPVLSKKMHVRQHLKSITHRETRATLEIMTFDPDVLTGQKISGGALIDELHMVAKMTKAAAAIRQIRGGMLPFPEAFLAFITTQSDGPPVGVFKAELAKARAVRDGRHRGAMLPVLYELPDAIRKHRDEWKNPKHWELVTPNAGRSISIPRLVEDFETAVAAGEDELRGWASQHLNLEIGLALRSDRWVGADFWESAARPGLDLDALIERSEVICVGIDGGGLEDLLGLSVIGRDRETREWLTWSRAWVHRSMLDRRKQEAAQLQDFAEDGDLVLVDEVGADTAELAEIVARIYASGKMNAGEPEKPTPMIGLDPVGVGAILEALVQAGIPQALVIGISQGWKLNAAIKTAERKLAEGVLVHGDRPLMAYCVSNARVEPKGNAVLITKQASGQGKIDPLLALLDAVSLMAMNPQPYQPPGYSLHFI